MTTDIVLTILNAVWGVILVGLGLAVVFVEPNTKKLKITYIALFLLFGGASVVTTAVLAVRSGKEARESTADSSTAIGRMQQKIDDLGDGLNEYIFIAQQQTPSVDISSLKSLVKIAKSKLPSENPIVPMSVPAPTAQNSTPISAQEFAVLQRFVLAYADQMDVWNREHADHAAQYPTGLEFERMDGEWRNRFVLAFGLMKNLQKLTGDTRQVSECSMSVDNAVERIDHSRICAQVIREDAEKLR